MYEDYQESIIEFEEFNMNNDINIIKSKDIVGMTVIINLF